MSALPYIYAFDVQIPPRWWSKRSIVQRIVLDTDFEIQEIRSKESYNFDIRIWFDGRPGMQQFFRSYNVCAPLTMPMLCPKGSVIQIEVQNYYWRVFSNKVQVAFCGNRLYPEPEGE